MYVILWNVDMNFVIWRPRTILTFEWMGTTSKKNKNLLSTIVEEKGLEDRQWNVESKNQNHIHSIFLGG